MKNRLHWTLAAVALPAACFAEELPTYTLPDIVVTTTRFQVPPAATPFNVVVISAADIERSPAQTLPDLLAQQAGIHIRNSSSSPDHSIDMRGFGMTGNQNTLVLVDGQRLNELELSTVKWSNIPLSSIERIEIVRGSGSVLYGDNATAGTIQIITKAPGKGRLGSVQASAGSYGTRNIEGTASLGDGRTGLRLTANDFHSDGYRVNNDNDQKNLSGDFRTRLGDGQFTVKFGVDDQDLRLPGARRVQPPSINQLETDRQGTATPRDYATRRGNYVSIGATHPLASSEVSAEIASRDKDQSIYNPTYPSGIYDNYVESSLDLLSFTPRVKVPYAAFGAAQTLVAGVDFNEWRYASVTATSPATLAAPKGRVSGNQDSRGIYFQNTSQFGKNTLVSLGGRVQQISYRIDNQLNAALSRTQERSLRAYEIGARHELDQGWAVFGKLGQSFRLPTVNEDYNAFSYTVMMLEPQTSHDRELGVELQRAGYRMRASMFQIDLENELHYNALTYTNMNLSPTRREGAELESKWSPAASLDLYANYTYTAAKFREGVYGGINVAGNDVPVVPRHLLSVGGSWAAQAKTRLGLAVNWVGEQRFDNDQANDFGQKMPAYTTVDVKLTHQIDAWTLSAAVNNLFNEKYFSYGVRSTFLAGTYNAYPMPERSILLSARYDFR